MGLRTSLPQRTHSAISPAGLAACLQSPPATLRDWQGPTHHTVDQPPWAVHLDEGVECGRAEVSGCDGGDWRRVVGVAGRREDRSGASDAAPVAGPL